MTGQAEQIINEVIQIKEQYFAEVGADSRRAWPRSIRERIMALDQMKMNRKEISNLTGVPYETIMQWRYYQNKIDRGFHALEVKKHKNATVTVALPLVADKEDTALNLTVTVTTPNGFKVEGVAEVVLKILKGLKVQ